MATSRHFAAVQQFGRIWIEADINHRGGFVSTRLNQNFVDVGVAHQDDLAALP
jgi:hypothetical protein